MNNHAKLLDCTLRDGAYLIDKKFGDETIHGIIRGLVDANIDIVEIGFLQDDGFGEGKTVFKNSKDARKFIPENKNNTSFTVLADFSRYSIENLDEYDGKSFDSVRACFFKYERKDVIDFCKKVKEKGYKIFVQPVDILGYSDLELIDLINDVNEIEPYCLSVVDTFGSMYIEDLHRVFSIINHNLISTSKIGFHSHNNMQMSNALSQEFLRMTYGYRNVIVDTTISGMGRGAGNTPTELVAEYMVKKLGYSYDIDAILDIIDNYMDNIRARCEWGYTTSYFIAGCYSAHVNNIAYLTQKSSIRSKDIRYILNKIGEGARKRYHYDLLEETYMDYIDSEIDDSKSIEELKKIFAGREVILMAPGKTVKENADEIREYIDKKENPLVVAINFVPEFVTPDFMYMSNIRRYNYWKDNEKVAGIRKILASNILKESEDDYIISFGRLVKCGWDHMENSAVMVLRLLDILGAESVSVAGMDGYSCDYNSKENYASEYLELQNVNENPRALNFEIADMLKDFLASRQSDMKVEFITKSKYVDIIGEI